MLISKFSPFGVFYMARVPRNRNRELKLVRAGAEISIIVGGVPIPPRKDALADPVSEVGGFFRGDVGNEVASETELVRTLERSRFRNTFAEQVSLPHGVAVRLEDFEAGLRSAGLMGVDEILTQSFTSPSKFRVQKRNVSVDGHLAISLDGGSLPRGASYASVDGLDRPPSARLVNTGCRADGGRAAVARRLMHKELRRRRRGF